MVIRFGITARECGFGLALRVTTTPSVYLSLSDTLNPVSHFGDLEVLHYSHASCDLS